MRILNYGIKFVFLTSFLLLLVLKCSTEPMSGNSTPDQSDSPILVSIPSDRWEDLNDLDHFVVFANLNEGELAGDLEGSEEHNTKPEFNNNLLTGSYENNIIDFVIQRSTGDVSFSGFFQVSSDSELVAVRTRSGLGDSLILVPPF